jgi:hypothetical protein
MTGFAYPKRIRAGAALLALVAVFSCLDTTRNRRWFEEDGATRISEERVQAVRRDLPSHGAIGYVGDEVPPNAGTKRYFHEFFHIQYAVAPLILVDSQQYPLVLGDFHQPVDSARIARLKLTLVKDYGNGVMLFRGRDR